MCSHPEGLGFILGPGICVCLFGLVGPPSFVFPACSVFWEPACVDHTCWLCGWLVAVGFVLQREEAPILQAFSLQMHGEWLLSLVNGYILAFMGSWLFSQERLRVQLYTSLLHSWFVNFILVFESCCGGYIYTLRAGCKPLSPPEGHLTTTLPPPSYPSILYGTFLKQPSSSRLSSPVFLVRLAQGTSDLFCSQVSFSAIVGTSVCCVGELGERFALKCSFQCTNTQVFGPRKAPCTNIMKYVHFLVHIFSAL